jgi:Domain of unknown function (DUF3523)
VEQQQQQHIGVAKQQYLRQAHHAGRTGDEAMALRSMSSKRRVLLLGGTAVLTAAGLAPGVAHAERKDEVANMFDPEALERGAKALREINKSPFAKQVQAIACQACCMLLGPLDCGWRPAFRLARAGSVSRVRSSLSVAIFAGN